MVPITNSITVEELLQILAVLVIPLIGGVIWTTTVLFSMKADIQSLEVMVKTLRDSENGRIERLERSVQEIRNLVTALLLNNAKQNNRKDSQDDNDFN